MRTARQAVLLVLVHLAAAETGARLFWWWGYGVPPTRPDRILYAYYPELQEVEASRPRRDDGLYDVLLLGGSVLQRDWSSIEPALRERLTVLLRRPVRLFNVAVRGHTSRDSLIKYQVLEEARFDLVLYYHGINDTRVNNAPPEVFRADYSHLPWYRVVNALAPYHGRAWLALPYTLRWLQARAYSFFADDRSVSPGLPRADWVEFGRDVRSASSFEANLRGVLDLASRRGDRVLLMTFAIWVPPDYSPRAFAEGRLDYAVHLSPLEIWGRPEYVAAAVLRHNAVVRRLAVERGVLLVDQARLMPQSGRFFNDACHLTVLGSSEFVAHVVDTLAAEPVARPERAAPASGVPGAPPS